VPGVQHRTPARRRGHPPPHRAVARTPSLLIRFRASACG